MASPGLYSPGLQLPAELQPVKVHVDSYVQTRLQQFWAVASLQLQQRFRLTADDCQSVLQSTLMNLAQADEAEQSAQQPVSFALVLCHDCRSSGCGASSCVLCQHNPSRPCARNTKPRYLEGEVLRAACESPLRAVVTDRDTGTCCAAGLLPGTLLEVHVMNADKYDQYSEPLSTAQLRECIFSDVKDGRPPLERKGSTDSQARVQLQPENGGASLADIVMTSSSTAMLGGRGSSFKLLVWAVDEQGQHVPAIGHAVSERFQVATRRMRTGIKPQLPLMTDDVLKLENIGKATADKLEKLAAALEDSGMASLLPPELHSVRTVGQCKTLMEFVEGNRDLSNKVRTTLKLAPEAWEELRAHAASALEPDARRRVWWCNDGQLGLVYECDKGAVKLDHPCGVVTADAPSSVLSLTAYRGWDELRKQLDTLKVQAQQAWRAQGHPGWALLCDSSAFAGPLSMELMSAMGLALGPSPQPQTSSPFCQPSQLQLPYPLSGEVDLGSAQPTPNTGSVPQSSNPSFSTSASQQLFSPNVSSQPPSQQPSISAASQLYSAHQVHQAFGGQQAQQSQQVHQAFGGQQAQQRQQVQHMQHMQALPPMAAPSPPPQGTLVFTSQPGHVQQLPGAYVAMAAPANISTMASEPLPLLPIFSIDQHNIARMRAPSASNVQQPPATGMPHHQQQQLPMYMVTTGGGGGMAPPLILDQPPPPTTQSTSESAPSRSTSANTPSESTTSMGPPASLFTSLIGKVGPNLFNTKRQKTRALEDVDGPGEAPLVPALNADEEDPLPDMNTVDMLEAMSGLMGSMALHEGDGNLPSLQSIGGGGSLMISESLLLQHNTSKGDGATLLRPHDMAAATTAAMGPPQGQPSLAAQRQAHQQLMMPPPPPVQQQHYQQHHQQRQQDEQEHLQQLPLPASPFYNLLQAAPGMHLPFKPRQPSHDAGGAAPAAANGQDPTEQEDAHTAVQMSDSMTGGTMEWLKGLA